MKITVSFIIRFHYKEKHPDFDWRFEYFKNKVLPRILNQTNQDFDICIWCEKHHEELFKSLSDKIKVFNADYIERVSGYFRDYTEWKNVKGLDKYNIQIGLDSDDLIEPDFIEKVFELCVGNEVKYISFQPIKLDIKTGKKYLMGQYHSKRGSPVFCLYQPVLDNNFIFAYHHSHIKLPTKIKNVTIIPEGYCFMSIHNLNDSTGIKETDRLFHLNIFTNSTITAPYIDIIKRTYKSFIDTFGKIPMTIYADPNPNIEKYDEYCKNLREYFKCEIIKTSSLSDGYIKSIKECEADYMFQLEHDWVFETKLIKHKLKQIIDTMNRNGLYHFRFSKHTNKLCESLNKWQSKMIEKTDGDLSYCETDNLSNNPHIIDRKYYLKNMMKEIKVKDGSHGIEEMITKREFISCQYGGLDYPPTIKHLNGKNK